MTSLYNYWLLSRSQCPRPAAIRAVDEHGAPLTFCRRHWAPKFRSHLAAQYGKVAREGAGK